MSKKQSQIISTTVENKTFNFEKDGTHLNFTLRVDVKNQLIAFEELLKNAITAVATELENRFNK